MICTTATIFDDRVLDRVAEIWEPRERPTPSEWAERERYLAPGTTAQPGQWSNDYLPWLAPMLDAYMSEPSKRGVIAMKPSQVAVSETHQTLAGYFIDHEPGPILFMFSKDEQARKFSLERFMPMIENSPALARLVRTGKKDHATQRYKETPGGPLILAGSGSANNFISNPYRHIFVDEYDDIGDVPGHGDPFRVLMARQDEWDTMQRCGIFVWAHPTEPDRGIARLYDELSDQREWIFDCPHCAESIVPEWAHVHIADNDPMTARYLCPHCTVEITDLQRARATGETGRFASQLPLHEARTRRFIGLHLSKLCHPRITVQEMAIAYCDCRTEHQLRTFYNKIMGLPYQPQSRIVTEQDIKSRVDPRHIDRSISSDTLFITGGVDVQAPEIDPTLYWSVCAWSGRGDMVVLEYGRSRGWLLLHNLICGFTATTEKGDEYRISAVGVDYGFATRQVYDFCRQNHAGVSVIPFKHTAGVKPQAPIRQKGTVDPSRRHLGELPRLETCRTHWMDRTLGRFHNDESIGGGIVLPASVDSEFINHILANKRFEVENEHGHVEADWRKPPDRRDDWAQSLVANELMAVSLGLDTIHQSIPSAPQAVPQQMRKNLGIEPESITSRRDRNTSTYRNRRRRYSW